MLSLLHMKLNVVWGPFMQGEVLVKVQQKLGETMGELGLAFIKISEFETEDGTLNS